MVEENISDSKGYPKHHWTSVTENKLKHNVTFLQLNKKPTMKPQEDDFQK